MDITYKALPAVFIAWSWVRGFLKIHMVKCRLYIQYDRSIDDEERTVLKDSETQDSIKGSFN